MNNGIKKIKSIILKFLWNIILIGALFFAVSSNLRSEAAYDAHYSLTIDHTKVTEDLTDFPVYVNLNDVKSGITLTEAQSIRIYDSNDNELAREIVSKDEMHFKAPSLSSSVDTTFKIVMDSISSDYWVSDTYGRNNVWTNNYIVVTHDMGDDSTANWHDGVGYWWVQIWWASGKLWNWTYFDWTNDYVSVPDANDLSFNGTSNDKPFTMSLWWKPAIWEQHLWLVSKFYNISFDGEYVFRPRNQSNWNSIMLYDNQGSNQINAKGNYVISTNTRWYSAVTYNWNRNYNGFKLHQNGLDVTSSGAMAGTYTKIYNRWANLEYGATIRTNLTRKAYFKWTMAEFRMSSIVRDTDRISTEYNNQSSPNTFYTITTLTPPWVPNITAVQAWPSQATVSFAPPANTGWSPILYYTVSDFSGSVSITGTTSPLTLTGLNAGETYQFVVTATNSKGTSDPSTPSSPITLSDVPGKVTNLTTEVHSSSIKLSRTTPDTDGWLAITDYLVQYQKNISGSWAFWPHPASTGTNTTIAWLSNNILYDFRVRAFNAVWLGERSDVESAMPGSPAQVLIQWFSDLSIPSILANVRITNEWSSNYEYHYTRCVTTAVDNLCGGWDDIFSSSAAKLIQVGQDRDTTLSASVPSTGPYYFHLEVHYGSETSRAHQSFTAIGNNPPTISTIANQTIDEDNTLSWLQFTVSDVETSANSLVISASSSNQSLVQDSNIILWWSGQNRTLAVAPCQYCHGSTTITLQVTDEWGISSQTSFVLTVNHINHDPQALDDSGSTTEWISTTIDVLANDSDIDSNALSIASIGSPSHGSASIVANHISYVPNSGYIGSDSFAYTISDGQWWSASASVTITISDITVPIATLNGSNSITINRNDSFVDPWASWTDNVDGAGSLSIANTGSVDTSTVGSYTLSYRYTDSSNNTSSIVTRVVNVVLWNAPVITLSWGDDITIAHGSTWTELGYSASDLEDGDLTTQVVVSWSVDTSTVGNYTLTYTVSDISDNIVTTQRIVRVTDQTAPVITLVWDSTTTLLRYVSFIDPWISRTDNVDGAGSINHASSGSLDITTLGSYTLEYRYIDQAGNRSTTLNRTINVIAGTAPTITLSWGDEVTLSYGSIRSELGYSAGDTEDGDLTTQVVISWSIDRYQLGQQTISYTVIDSNGNTTSKVRIVRVIDDHAPNLYWASINASGDIISLERDKTLSLPILGSTGMSLSGMIHGNLEISSISQSGSLTLLHLSRVVYSDEVLTLSYDSLYGDFHDSAATPNNLESITNWMIANDSIIHYNYLPLAHDDTFTISQDTPSLIDVLANDTDANGDTLSIVRVGSGNHGETSISGNYIAYTPMTAYNGSDNFSYTISDGITFSTGQVILVITRTQIPNNTTHPSWWGEYYITPQTNYPSDDDTINNDIIIDNSDVWINNTTNNDTTSDNSDTWINDTTIISTEEQSAYDFARQYDITTKSSSKTASLHAIITRAEFAKMIVNYAYNFLTIKADETRANTCQFDDLWTTSEELAEYAKTSCRYGLLGINMWTSHFYPNQTLTRAEVVTAISRLYHLASDNSTIYYLNHMKALKDNGIITFTNPSSDELRVYVMIILQKLSQKEELTNKLMDKLKLERVVN